jgi:hypothetical protein
LHIKCFYTTSSFQHVDFNGIVQLELLFFSKYQLNAFKLKNIYSFKKDEKLELEIYSFIKSKFLQHDSN